jgi:hypothetical protein
MRLTLILLLIIFGLTKGYAADNHHGDAWSS